MNWLQRKIFLYNVTFGLYMLDWWERYLFNTLIIVLMFFLFNMGSRIATEFVKGNTNRLCFSCLLLKLICYGQSFCCWLRDVCLEASLHLKSLLYMRKYRLVLE
ncbi:hypothetical protein RND81_09G053800 [Saponaria officinalis]|uniref:Uncharacterized protein n=1 Tax=Saponaria officinalis TaxID=3572 RepID=A0AAW1IIA9_SAPOF